MKKLIFIILILFVATVAYAACPGGVCYVRPDGGTAAQCNGGSDVAYSSGVAPNCALKHWWYASGWWTGGTEASPTGGQAGVMTGGDLVIIKNGSYQCGNDSNTTGYFTNCGSTTTACKSRAVPSGTSENYTQIYGCSATGCSSSNKSTYPELWASGRTEHVISLKASEYVDIGWLNITDHAACGYNHPTMGCGSADIDELSGKDGILVRYSSNVTLRNLWVHGFRSYGLYGGNVTNLSVIDSNIDLNSFGGWNADSCSAATTCQESGTIAFSGSTPITSTSVASSISWNGCVENPNSPGNAMVDGCYTQGTGGYGDGIGTAPTSGAWSFTQCDVSHNTSDGIDLLYMNKDGVTGGTITVKRSRMEGNVGNQLKIPNNATIEDNLIIGNCWFFDNSIWEVSSAFTNCRAGGDTIAIAWRNASSVSPTFYNNTIVGGDSQVFMLSGESSSCTSGINILVKNNNILGSKDYTGSTESIGFWYNSQVEGANTCWPEIVSDNNSCSGYFDSHGNCTADSTANGYKMSSTGSVYTATPTDVFTGTILQGPSIWYTDTDYMDQLTIKNGSIAQDLADESLAGDDVYDFNYYNRGASWDSGGLEYGTVGQSPGPVCGNNTIETGETCDGTDLTPYTSDCSGYPGYSGGTLSCAANCLSFVTMACTITNCGNGNIDSGEQCDTTGPNLNGQTCASLGYSAQSNLLACTASTCQFNTSGCLTIACQDGYTEGTEQCDDGNSTNGDGCSSMCETEIAAYQHFLADYIETDPNSHLTRTTHKIAINGLNHAESAKVQKDFGVGFFENYTIKGHYVMDSCTSTQWEDCGIGVFSLTEVSHADLAAQETALDGISLTFSATSNFASKTWKLVIEGVLADSAADSNPFTSRYWKITVSGTTVTVNFYSDPTYSTEITDLALTGTYSGNPPRYGVVASSYNSSTSGVSFSGSIENVEVTVDTPPEPPAQGCTGTTTDYCIIPELSHLASGGSCSTTGTCGYLCTNTVLSEVSNTCTEPIAPIGVSVIINGQTIKCGKWP